MKNMKASDPKHAEKAKVLVAIRKARTSLEKIETMVEEEERDCFPVIQQVLAAIGLLKSANLLMLDRHIERHLDGLGKKGDVLRSELVRIVKTAQSK
jgi:DNA-binding FrmR family transcriptional regulator